MEGVPDVADAEDLAGAVAVSALRGRGALGAEDGVGGEGDGVAGADLDDAVLGQFVAGAVLAGRQCLRARRRLLAARARSRWYSRRACWRRAPPARASPLSTARRRPPAWRRAACYTGPAAARGCERAPMGVQTGRDRCSCAADVQAMRAMGWIGDRRRRGMRDQGAPGQRQASVLGRWDGRCHTFGPTARLIETTGRPTHSGQTPSTAEAAIDFARRQLIRGGSIATAVVRPAAPTTVLTAACRRCSLGVRCGLRCWRRPGRTRTHGEHPQHRVLGLTRRLPQFEGCSVWAAAEPALYGCIETQTRPASVRLLCAG